MEDSTIHCTGCGDNMNAFSRHSLILESVRSNRCSAREFFFQAVSEVFDSPNCVKQGLHILPGFS